ncbi:MAG: hypothetical protein P1P84_09540 [Deferrisomatales bacterium]|nr:hypothetical protein [Deferrisomatales bacterium]
MVYSFFTPGVLDARWLPSQWFCPVLALLLVACSPKVPLHIGPGTTLGDLPGHYSIVLGRLEVWLGDEPYLCALPDLACGLSVRSEAGQSFLIPYSPPTAHWLPGSSRSPFFVIRLPAGEYTISRFQGPEMASLRKVGAGPGSTAIDKRFRVKEKEIVYIGSLVVRVSADRGERPMVYVTNEQREAKRVAGEVAGVDNIALGTSLMH